MTEIREISVIVRTRDRVASLREALRSLREQTFRQFETVVVDDGETPIDPRSIELDTGAPVRVVRQEAPHGRARALNTGLRAARGRFVAYLDDDDLYLPHHLEVLHSFLVSEPGRRAAYSDALLVRQSRQPDGSYRDAEPIPIFGQDFRRSALLFSNFIPLLCLLHERSLAPDAGWVDESLDLFEDWDFLIRASAVAPFSRVPTPTALYRVRDDGTNATTLMPWLGPESEAQRKKIVEKHLGELTSEVILDFLNAEEARRNVTLERNARLEAESAAAARSAEMLRQEIERLRRESEARGQEIASLRQELSLSAARERDLSEKVTSLEATVHQMTSSLAWRLFTPYWKWKAFLASRR